MSWITFADWQIGLSLVTPAAVGVLLCLLERYGPLAPWLQRPNGLVPGYFVAVGTLFGLVTALLMSDVWRKENLAFESVVAESDAMRAIAHIARVNNLEATVVPAIKAYAEVAEKELPYSRAPEDARSKTDLAFDALLTLSHAEAGARSELMTACTELRRARDRRLYLSDDQTALTKWLSVLVLGALTQLALLLVHVGNRHAIRIGVGLFTVAFTFCLVIIAVFDEPFETVLVNAPTAIFDQTMSEL